MLSRYLVAQQLETINCESCRRKQKTSMIKVNFSSYLNSAVFRAGGKPVTPVRESQVEDLVAVFSQRLNLHTGDTVKQTPELPVPRHSRCTKTEPELFNAATCHIAPYTQLRQNIWFLVPGCRGTERGMR